jgi:Leucine-rich repeat (LRR) protein
MDVRFKLFCSKNAASELFFKPSPRCTSDESLFMHRLAALTELNLSHNNLSIFPSFASEIQLEILDLSFNSITYFSDDEIQTIDNMKPLKIYLKGNPLLRRIFINRKKY